MSNYEGIQEFDEQSDRFDPGCDYAEWHPYYGDGLLADSESGESEIPDALPEPEAFVITPSADRLTLDEWRLNLEEGYTAIGLELEGDFDRAAACLVALGEGVAYVHRKFAERGIQLPPLATGFLAGTVEEEKLDGVAMTAPNERIVYLSTRQLAACSSVEPDELVEASFGDSDAIGFRGTVHDYYRLIGVEEAHHDAYNQLVGPSGGTNEPSMTEYDATEPEWQALRWQCMAAREMGMPPETIAVLEGRLQAAKEFRRAQRG